MERESSEGLRTWFLPVPRTSGFLNYLQNPSCPRQELAFFESEIFLNLAWFGSFAHSCPVLWEAHTSYPEALLQTIIPKGAACVEASLENHVTQAKAGLGWAHT